MTPAEILILTLVDKYGPMLVANLMAALHAGTPTEQNWIDFGNKVASKSFDDYVKVPPSGTT